MLLDLYLFFSGVAIVLFIFTIMSQSWLSAMTNTPFLVLLVPSSYNIQVLKATHLVTNATAGTVTFHKEYVNIVEVGGTQDWVLGIMWAFFFFLNVGLFLYFYSTGEFSDFLKSVFRGKHQGAYE